MSGFVKGEFNQNKDFIDHSFSLFANRSNFFNKSRHEVLTALAAAILFICGKRSSTAGRIFDEIFA